MLLIFVAAWFALAGAPPGAESHPKPSREQVRLIGAASIPGDARDRSGLTDVFQGGMPHDRLGSMGSAIAWTGAGDRYLLLADRGPYDGATAFRCRWHEYRLEITPGAKPAVQATLLSTTLLSGGETDYIGFCGAFVGWNSTVPGRRLDPEALRVLPDGEVLLVDEYGPEILRFERLTGRRLATLSVPGSFNINKPSPDADAEIKANTHGRVANKGFEGLAVSPDGATAWAMLESPLIQDGGTKGRYVRMLETRFESGAQRQLVYPLTNATQRLSEALGVDDHTMLVIERDGAAGREARSKRIMLADLRGASDVTPIDALPSNVMPSVVRTIRTRTLIDLLDPALGLAGEAFPAKIEGLCFGPDLPGGERCLIVTSDNDLKVDEPTWIWVFAVPPALLAADRP